MIRATIAALLLLTFPSPARLQDGGAHATTGTDPFEEIPQPRPPDPPVVQYPSQPDPDKPFGFVPPEVATRIFQQDVEAINQVRTQIVEDIQAGRVEEKVGRYYLNRVRDLETAGKPRVQPTIQADLSQLEYSKNKSVDSVGSGNFEHAHVLAEQAFTDRRSRHPERADVESVIGPPRKMDDINEVYQRRREELSVIREVPSPSKEEKPVKGVRILIDEGILREALRGRDRDAALAEIEALEDALLGARSQEEAWGKLQAYTEAKKRAFLDSTRKLHPAEDVRTVSLKSLSGKAAPYRDRWSQRPEELRTLGGLTRIHGFLWDEAAADLVIVGRAEKGAPPILFDSFTVGLRSVWKEGRTPECSLDPDPSDPGGAQYSRVGGVPDDSAFARVMLEADYAMKRIMAKAPGEEMEIAGYKSLVEWLAEKPTPRFNSRFWLYPVQPRAREIQLGAGGTSALFNAEVQVLAEEMAVAGNQLVGTGTVTEACDRAAASFSEHYESIASRRPIFRELRSLFDIVLLARVLRLVRPSDPLLEALAALPYDRAEIPKIYAGLTVRHEISGRLIVLSGGCEVATRVGSRNLIDGGSVSADVAAGRLSLPEGAGRGDDRAFALGLSDLAQGRFEEARDRFSEALARNASFAAAYAYRAIARFRLGERDAALQDARMAARIEPRDPAMRATYFQVALESGKPNALQRIDDATRSQLLQRYVVGAASAFVREDFEESLRQIDRAIEVDPAQPMSLARRAAIRYFLRDLTGAEADASRAVELDPKTFQAYGVRGWVRLLREDFRGAAADFDRIVAALEIPTWLGARALARLLAEDYEGAAADAESCVAKDPHGFLAMTVGMVVKLCADAGPAKARAWLLPQLRLPPLIPMTFAQAMDAEMSGRPKAAAELFEKVLALVDACKDEAVVRESLIRERTENLLVQALAEAAPPEPKFEWNDHYAYRDRVEKIGRGLIERHPDWMSGHLSRAMAYQALGNREESLKSLDEALKKDATKDLLLGEMLGGEGSIEAMIHVMRMQSLIKDVPRSADALMETAEQLSRLLQGSPVVPACRGMATLFQAMKSGGADMPPDLLPSMRRLAAELSAAADAPRKGLEIMLSFLFYTFYVTVEDGAREAERLDSVARDFFRMRIDSEFSIFTAKLHEMRAAFCEMMLSVYGRQIGQDGGMKRLWQRAEVDPERMEKEYLEIVAPWVRRAEQSGEPAFAYLVKETLRLGARDAPVDLLRKRGARVDEAEARRRKLEESDAAEIGKGIEAAFREAKTLTQSRTLAAVLGIVAKQAGSQTAAPYRPPKDVALAAPKMDVRAILSGLGKKKIEDASPPASPDRKLPWPMFGAAAGALLLLFVGILVLRKRVRTP